MDNPGTVPSKGVPPMVVLEMEGMDKEVKRLSEEVMRLGNRLLPVLNRKTSEELKEEPKNLESNLLSYQIACIRKDLNKVYKVILDMQDRLEI